MVSTIQNLKFTFRRLAKRPGFAAVAIIVMALGIGANTAIFSVVDAVLLRELPFPETNRLVQLWHVPPQTSFPGMTRFSLSAANFLDWQRQSTSFEQMAAYTGARFVITGRAEPERVRGSSVTADFFPLLGIQPIYGRTFLKEEDQPGHNRTVILSYRFWKTHFGSDPHAVNSSILLDGEPYTIVGVMGPKMQRPDDALLWVPMGMTDQEAAVRNEHHYLAMGRLKPGVSISQAQAELDAISKRLEQAYPADNKGWGAKVISLREEMVGEIRPALLMMLAAVGFVLLIACANVANLMFARTLERRKDIAIRSALGARPGVLMRQAIEECVILCVSGGALGLVLAHFGIELLLKYFADRLPPSADVGLDLRVLLFTAVLSVVTGILAGSGPAWLMSRANISDTLKQGLGRTDSDAGHGGIRFALVAIEVGLSFVLFIGAGLMIRSLWNLQNTDPGFDPHHVMTAEMVVNKNTFTNVLQETQFVNQLLSRLRALPGVESAGAVNNLPLQGGSNQPVAVEGQPSVPISEQPEVSVRVVTPAYMKAMQIRLLKGRDITESDTPDSAPVILISESMANQFWPKGDAIGHHVRLSFFTNVDREVVGVVADVKQNGLDNDIGRASLYWPLAQTTGTPTAPWRPQTLSLAVRTSGAPQEVGRSIVDAVHELNRDIPVQDVMSMDELISETLAQPTFNMELLVLFGTLALILSLVGIYSVLAYSVRRRQREFALRMALGATWRDIVRLVAVQGLKPTLVGTGAGVFGAFLLGRLVASQVYGVEPTDPTTLATVAVLMCAVSLVASVAPAILATRVEPSTVLQDA